MKIQDFIATIGDRAAAELFGISERAAESYRLGTRKPRPEVAQRIVEKTSGKVDWEGIYTPSTTAKRDVA